LFLRKGGIHVREKKIIYVCSPYSGNISLNTERAKIYSRMVVDRGAIPVTPHLFLPLFLDEETERDAAIEMDLALLKRCDELWAFGDTISSGMKREMKEAENLGIPVRRITPTGQEEWICTK
jgi:hypothetical protein